MNCILFACYLPSHKKRYVLEEIINYIKIKEKSAKLFIGIQHNSIPETEEILYKIKGKLNIEMRRVHPELMIDSDASSFVSALSLYAESDMNFNHCYFIHTKGITSNNDNLRQLMYKLIFDTLTVESKLNSPYIGSYAPYLTLTDHKEDIIKMSCLSRFCPDIFTHNIMEYYYINTFYVIKNELLKNFIKNLMFHFFDMNILQYSDRYMMERDFSHIVDAQGYLPSFSFLHGNYTTNYVTPTMDKYEEKLNKWNEDNKNEKN